MGSIWKGPASKGLGKCLWWVSAIQRVEALRELVVELQLPEDYPRENGQIFSKFCLYVEKGSNKGRRGCTRHPKTLPA